MPKDEEVWVFIFIIFIFQLQFGSIPSLTFHFDKRIHFQLWAKCYEILRQALAYFVLKKSTI